MVIIVKHTFWFWIRRTHRSPYEAIKIEAQDSWEAINSLPRCITWDFQHNHGNDL